MKNDQFTSAIINFLLPIIFLYGCFFFVGFFEVGFFALIYGLVLIFGASLIFYITKVDFKMFLLIAFENIAYFLLVIAIFYLIFLLIFITDFSTIHTISKFLNIK